MQQLLDVVIPVHGQLDRLRACVKALELSQLDDFGTIIVDDASPDYNVLRPYYNELTNANKGYRVIKHDKNLGFPETVNDGVARGSAPLILMLNSDVEVSSSLLTAMALELDDPDVGVVGALLTFPIGSKWGNDGKIQHAGMAFDAYGKPFHIHLGWEPDNERIVRGDKWQCVTGACLMTRRALWNTVGGLNKIYSPGTYEDVELCFAIRNLGKKVVFTPSAKAVHHTGSSIVGVQSGFPLQRNHTLFRSRYRVQWDEYFLW